MSQQKQRQSAGAGQATAAAAGAESGHRGIPWCATASLFEEVDKRVLVVVRDVAGQLKHLYGILRSYDTFGTVVLEGTVERIIVNGTYSERRCGLYIVRGENIVLLCEVSPEKERASLATFKKVDLKEAEAAQKAAWEEEERDVKRRKDMRGSHALGIEEGGL
eukprot:m51a1_g1253 hypothetical protein (163) ;mRNA; r:37083-37870